MFDINEDVYNSKDDKVATKISKTVVSHIGTLIVIVVSIVWLFQGFFKPDISEVSFWARVIGSFLSIVVAVTIQSSMGLQAIIRALDTNEIKEINKKHLEIIEEANEYAEYADEWADVENAKTYKKARVHILSSVGLKYGDYFDEDGSYNGKQPEKKEDFSKLQIKQHNKRLKRLYEAVNIKLTPLTFAAISATDSVNYDINDLGKTPMEYQRIKSMKKLLTKILTVGLLGQITWSLVAGENWLVSLYTGAVQLAIFLVFGAVDYLSNWNYIMNTHKGNVSKKINRAKSLINYGKKKRGEHINGD